MQLRDFTGGLNLRHSPTLLEVNQAVIYSNIDNSKGSLHPVKSSVRGSESLDKFFYKYKDEVFTSSNYRHYLEYDNRLYFSEEGVGLFKHLNGNTYKAGIVAPIDLPAFDENNNPIFNDKFSQVVGLVIEQQNHVKEDFVVGSTEINGNFPAGTQVFRVYPLENNKQIAEFEYSITFNANQGVDFEFSTTNEFILARKHTDNKFYMVSKGRYSIGDQGNALNTAASNEVVTALSTDTKVTQYCYTYVNSLDNTESAPSPFTEEFDRQIAKRVKLSNFTVPDDPQVDAIKVYRLDPEVTEPALVGIFSVLTDPVTEERYIDPVYDYFLSSDLTTLLDSTFNEPPPADLVNLVEAYGLVFGSFGNTLMFSRGKPDYFPSANAINITSDITGLLAIPDGILVFTKSTTQLLLGTSAADFRLVPVSKEHGCATQRSINIVKNIPVWANLQGIVSYQAGSIAPVSRPRLGDFKFDIVNTAVVDETYFVLLSDQRVMALDLRYDPCLRTVNFGTMVRDICEYDNELLYNDNGFLTTAFKGPERDTTIHYKSPEFTEGDITNEKNYDAIRVSFTGELVFKAFIDGREQISETIKSNVRSVRTLKPQVGKHKGYTIQFEIQGKGIVYEIAYLPEGRLKK